MPMRDYITTGVMSGGIGYFIWTISPMALMWMIGGAAAGLIAYHIMRKA